MRTFARSALISSVIGVLLIGCGGSQPPIGAPGVMPPSALAARTTSTNYKIVYSFGAYPDGEEPYANVIDVNGTLYGTTYAGGTNSCATSMDNNTCGTVFSVTTGGSEKVLYDFSGPYDACLIVALKTLAICDSSSGPTGFGLYRGASLRIVAKGDALMTLHATA